MKFYKNSTTAAFVLLGVMGIVALASVSYDSVTTDESPHITSGYSYLKLQDMRLNPEHPPLIKDIAAIPLLFQDINFPIDHTAWRDMVNAQWDLGPQFLYRSGNDPDKIIFWGRIGPILLTLLFGWFVFKWGRDLFGSMWGLFALTLFAFSPTIMAHGRLVTTDVPAAFAFFFAIYYYTRFLKNPSGKNLVFAGIAFAIAQLIKFSLVLLLGFLPGITLLWVLINLKSQVPMTSQTTNLKPQIKSLGIHWSLVIGVWSFITSVWPWALRFIAILAITALIVLPVYQFHVLNYPPEKQIEDIQHILSNNTKFPALTDALVWMSDKPVLRAYAHYMLGVSMVFMRVAGGNTTYFLGEVSNQAWWYYFPVVFLLKVPMALLIFIALSLILVLRSLLFRFNPSTDGEQSRTTPFALLTSLKSRLRLDFEEIAMLLFVIFYWVISITGNLNIGVRHVLPTFPFIYLLIAGQMKRWVAEKPSIRAKSMLGALKTLFQPYLPKIGNVFFIGVLLGWYILSFVGIYPHFIAYFNEIAGGPRNGYTFVVDSNLDWGQDLRRLAKFVKEKNIDHIKVDYFGGGDVKYYLGDRTEIWHADNGPTTGWLAVSATFLQTSRAYPDASYAWLDQYEPVEKIGYSIFVYNIE